MKKFLMALALAAALRAPAQSVLDQALSERRQGHFEKAILMLQGQLKQEPKDTWAWYELGLTYATDSQYAKAVDAYKLALSYGFKDGQCRCALALALRETHQPMAALNEAGRCLELLPGYAGAWNLMGNAEIDLGHFDQALKNYQKAVELSPDYANARFNLAVACEDLGRDGEAEGAFKETVRLQPSMSEAWDALGNCQLRLKHFKDALATFKQALRLSPQDAEAEWGLARAYRALGNRKAFAEHMRANTRLVREADSRARQSQGRPSAPQPGPSAEAWGPHEHP